MHIITDELHSTSLQEKLYEVKVFPVVYSFIEDHRKDKKSDYVILKLQNWRLVAVFELQFSVGSIINAKSSELSQPGSWCKLIGQKTYEQTLCILANHHNCMVYGYTLAHESIRILLLNKTAVNIPLNKKPYKWDLLCC